MIGKVVPHVEPAEHGQGEAYAAILARTDPVRLDRHRARRRRAAEPAGICDRVGLLVPWWNLRAGEIVEHVSRAWEAQ